MHIAKGSRLIYHHHILSHLKRASLVGEAAKRYAGDGVWGARVQPGGDDDAVIKGTYLVSCHLRKSWELDLHKGCFEC